MKRFKNRTEQEQISDDFQLEPDLREALEILEESAFSREELDRYDRYWDTIISEQSLIEDAERKGRTEGRAEGEQIGETRKALEMAKNLKPLGILNNAQIAQITNLSLQQIETL